MKEKRKLELKEKGWTEKDLHKAQKLLEEERTHDAHFSRIVFWSALVVTIFANIVVSLILIPFLIFIAPWALYTIVILLGGSIGFLYELLITDIGHLKTKHHISASVVLPLIAVVNVAVMVIVANTVIAEGTVTSSPHNPWIVAIVFAVAFILPYVFLSIKKKRK